MKQLFLLTFTLCFLSIQAQTNTYKRCLYTGRWAAGSQPLPETAPIPTDNPVPDINFHQEVETALQEIIKLSGIEGRKISLKHSSRIELMLAEDNPSQPKTIFYNYKDMRLARSEYKNSDGDGKWVLYGILAHEIGHILYDHFAPSNVSSPHNCEFEADAFAARMLYRMGANHAQIQAAYLDPTLLSEKATATHPPRSERIDAALKVWEEAGGKLGVSMYNEYLVYDYTNKEQEAFLDLSSLEEFCSRVVPKESLYSFNLCVRNKKKELTLNKGLISKTGRIILPPIYNDIRFGFSCAWVQREKDKKWGLFSFKGEVKIPFKYEDAYNFSDNCAPIKLNGKWGFIDYNDAQITPIKYDSACCFWGGMSRVQLQGKWGCIDTNGIEFIPLKYDTLDVGYHMVKVGLDKKYGYVDKSGKEVIHRQYDEASDFTPDGYAKVSKDGKTFIIDTHGNCVADCP